MSCYSIQQLLVEIVVGVKLSVISPLRYGIRRVSGSLRSLRNESTGAFRNSDM